MFFSILYQLVAKSKEYTRSCVPSRGDDDFHDHDEADSPDGGLSTGGVAFTWGANFCPDAVPPERSEASPVAAAAADKLFVPTKMTGYGIYSIFFYWSSKLLITLVNVLSIQSARRPEGGRRPGLRSGRPH